MIYFKGEFYGCKAPREPFYVFHENHIEKYELLKKIVNEATKFGNEYGLYLPVEDWMGEMPCTGAEDDCGYVYISMIESNAFADEEEFDMVWEGVMRALGRGKL